MNDHSTFRPDRRLPGIQARPAAATAEGRPTRRRFSGMLASFAVFPFLDWPLGDSPLSPDEVPLGQFNPSYPLYDQAVASVVPPAGFQSRITLGDAVPRLVRHEVIDPGKFFALYSQRGGRPPEFDNVLSRPATGAMRITADNAVDYVNLLWPVGLANRMAANAESPLRGDNLDNFASTGGWPLGRAESGGQYFDSSPIVELTPEAEERVVRIAKATYRPCCNNSTFFQDCNHGSALLGLFQLGASQGLSDDELYREGLAFNSFWFPENYVMTALYFKVFKETDWRDVDPKVVLGLDYSAIGPWQETVETALRDIPNLIPEPEGGVQCGV